MTDAEIYLAHLDNITEGREPVIRQVPSGDPSLADIAVFTYENWPRPGFITGFTFGLSLATHADWKHGRAELMISMESLDPAWPFSIGYLASRLRGDCTFSYGNTINFREQISDESGMDAFLIFAPPHLDRDQKLVKMNSFDCFIAGVYPLYSTELALYEKVGIKAFWHLSDWDPMTSSVRAWPELAGTASHRERNCRTAQPRPGNHCFFAIHETSTLYWGRSARDVFGFVGPNLGNGDCKEPRGRSRHRVSLPQGIRSRF